MELISYLKTQANLPEPIEARLNDVFKRQEFTKGHELLPPQNFSRKVFFVEKGLARLFYLKEGKDITHLFLAENSFTMPIESIFYNKPSPYGLELLEDSTIWYASYAEVETYVEQSSELEKFIRLLLIDVLKIFSDRLYALQFQSAKEKYQSMIDKHPNILLRAPLGHIASYLGITQQTLSVIRGQIS